MRSIMIISSPIEHVEIKISEQNFTDGKYYQTVRNKILLKLKLKRSQKSRNKLKISAAVHAVVVHFYCLTVEK